MDCREINEYSTSLSSSCRPYMGWLGPSILTATEGWPFLQIGIALCSRSIEVLVNLVSNNIVGRFTLALTLCPS